MNRPSRFRSHYVLFIVLIAPILSGSLIVMAQDKGLSEMVAADGTKLRYVVEGKGIPWVVVNRSNYQQVYSKELRKHLKLIFLDLRHGSEFDPPAKVEYVTLDTLVDDMEQVRKTLGLERIAVMGHSLPSVIALEYARKYPERTSHVILISSTPYFIPPKDREAFWESDASPERKLANQRNRERITDMD